MTKVKENAHHKSDAVEVTVEHKPECMVELTVKASPDLVKKGYRKAIKSIAKEVSIPGFRKGKAPDTLIVKNYHRPLEDRWQKEIADESFKEAQQLAKVPVLNGNSRITFDMKSHSQEDGAEMTFSFETEPVIPAIKPEDLEIVGVEPQKIEDKDVNQTIEDIRSYFGSFENVEGRAVKEDDYVTVDITNLETNELAVQNHRFQANLEKMPEWLYKLTKDMKVGDEKEGVSQADKDASEEEKKNHPPKKVSVKLNAIQALNLPALDDELAKKVGVATIDEMQTRLKKLLEKRAEKESMDAMRDSIADALVGKYKFEMPKSILEKEVAYRTKQLTSDPQYQQKVQGMSAEEKKESLANLAKHAENAVRLFYLCREVCDANKIDVTPDDVANQQIETPLDAMFVDRNDFYDYKSLSQEQRAIVFSRVMLKKAEDFLIGKAKKKKASEKKKEPAVKKTAKKAPAKKTVKKKSTTAKKGETKKRAPKDKA